MSDTNPYTPPHADGGALVTIRFSDPLPKVCMICGAPATGTAAQTIAVPADAASGVMEAVSFFAKRVSFVTSKPKHRATPSSNVLQMPHCDAHADAVRTALDVRPINHLKVEVSGLAPAFCEALAALQAPPSAEMLAAMDNRANSEGGFLKAIEKAKVSTPNEFLKRLEGDSRSS